MRKRILSLVILFLLLIPLRVFGEVKLRHPKQGGVESKSVMQWHLGYYLVGEAEAKHFIFQGVSKKSLKLKLEEKWEAYQGQIISVEYMVNDGAPKILQEAPRFHLSNYAREMTIYFNEEAIQKIEALQAEDELILLINTNKGASTQIEISPEVLEEWLAVYHRKLH